MGQIKYLALGLFLMAASAMAQHSVTLKYTASTDSTSTNPGSVTVYRAAANCPASGIGNLTYIKVTTSAPAGGPYNDTTVTAGTTYCYYLTAVISGQESGPSSTAGVTVLIYAPTGLTATSN